MQENEQDNYPDRIFNFSPALAAIIILVVPGLALVGLLIYASANP